MDQEINTIEGTARADFLFGSWRDDLILAGAGNDLIFARAGNDMVDAGDGNDRVFAGSGDDLVKTGLGRDFADGGRGIDTAQFDGDSSDYRITSFFGLTFVTDLRNGETDTLIRFEFLKFDDGLFDINGNPVATDPEAVDDEASTIEDAAITINVLANDSDPNNDPLTVAEATATFGSVDINTDGTLQYTPPENFSGEDTITYIISDGKGGTSSATVTVQVDGVADMPTLLLPDALETIDLAPISLDGIDASLKDTDGSESLKLKFGGLPEGATISKPGDIAQKTEEIDALIAQIGDLDQRIADLEQSVAATAQAIATLENSPNPAPGSGQVLANLRRLDQALREDLAKDTDERERLEAQRAEASAELSKLTKTADADGHIEIEDFGDGYVLQLPKGTVDDVVLEISAVATESDPVASDDVRTAETTAKIVIAVKENPTLRDDEAVTREDTPVTIKVLANDEDRDELTITEVTDGKLGTVAINDDGTVDYRPNRDVSGEDMFTYTVEDGNGGVSAATVKVLIGGVADAPQLLAPQAYETRDLADIQLEGFLARLVDRDESEKLTVKFSSLPAGAVILNAPAIADKDAAIADLDSLIEALNADIEALQSDIEELSEQIFELEQNNAEPQVIEPVRERRAELQAQLAEKTAANAKARQDRDQLNFERSELTKEADANGEIEFHDLENGFVLRLAEGTTEDFKMVVLATAAESEPILDGDDPTAERETSIEIRVRESLQAKDDAVDVVEDTAVTISVLDNDAGDSGGPLNVVAVSLPQSGSAVLNDDNTITYTPKANFNGVDELTYTVQDGNGDTSMATVKVTVGGVADTPDLRLPPGLSTTDLAPIRLDDINATLIDQDGSESLKVKFSGLPPGTVISNPAFVSGIDGRIKVVEADIGRLNATKTQKEEQVLNAEQRINELKTNPEPTQQELDELADLEQLKEALVSELQQIVDDIGQREGLLATLREDLTKVSQTAGDDGHVEFEEFGDGYFLQLPEGTIDDFTLRVEATATESEPLASPDAQTATAAGEVRVSVEEGPTAVDDELSVREDEPGQIDVLANDAASVTFDSVGNGTHGTTRDLGNGVVEYTPNLNYSGSDAFTYSVVNPDGTVSEATVRVIVNGVADMPGLAVPEVLQTVDLADISLDEIRGTSADGDGSESLLIRLSDVPDGAVVTNPGAIRDREAEQNSLDASIKSLRIEIDSKQQQVDDKQRELADLRDNNAAQVEIDAKQQEIDDLNRQISDHTKDIEQANERINELELEIEVFTISPPPGFGGIVGYDGSIGGWVLRLPPGTTEDFVLGVEALAFESDPVLNNDDRQAASERIAVGVKILESGQAHDDSVSTDEDTAVVIDVLANDLGDIRELVDVSEPTSGSAQLNADGTITYTPADDFNGPVSFSYTIEDEAGSQSKATVSVTVDPVNDDPQGLPVISGSPEVDQTLTADVGGITDADGLGQFTYQWELFTGGDINSDLSWNPIAGASQQSFTPDSDLVDQQVRVRVFYTDGGDTFETAVSAPSAEIAAANQDPIANDDAFAVRAGLGLNPVLDVLRNDEDLDSDRLTIIDVGDPGNGTAEIRELPGGFQGLVYTPEAGFVGTDSFTYEISDGNGGMATATVTVTVDDGGGRPPGDDGGRPPGDGGGRPPPGDGGGGRPPPDVIFPILPNPIEGNSSAPQEPIGGTMTGTPDSDVFLFSQGDGAVSLLGFQQATGTAGGVADQIQLSGFGLAFADLDGNDDGRVDADDAGDALVSGGAGAPLALDFGGGDVLLVNGVSFLTEDDLLFV